MNVAEAMARTLDQRGVRDVFALMGGGNLRMIHHLVRDCGVRVHHCRHEASAVNAADGYARATGSVGVCTVTHGPGFTNTITAVLTAQRARTPLVMITTDSSQVPGMASPFATVQALQPELLLDPLGIRVVRVRASTAAADTARAWELAGQLRRPVVLVLAAGQDGVDTTTDSAPPSSPQPEVATGRAPKPDEAALDAAANMLLGASNPVLLAGRGVVASASAPAVRHLAHRSGAALVTTLPAAGLFAGDPNDRGIMGGFSTEMTAELLRDCDCLIAFGASLNWFTTRRGELIEGVPVVHVDKDPDALGRYDTPALGIAADVREVLDGLIARLASSPPKQEREFAPLAPDAFEDLSDDGALDPRAVVRALHELLPADRAVFTDAGHFSGFPVYQMPVQSPDAFGFMVDFGAVGSVLGAGAGAAIGRPDRATVAFVGDGGLFMTLGELDLLVRDQVPLLVACMNDQAYGSELVHLAEVGLPPTEALFDTPDLARIAAAVGVNAERTVTIAALRTAVRGWLAHDRPGPLLLDVPISRAVRSPLYSHI